MYPKFTFFGVLLAAGLISGCQPEEMPAPPPPEVRVFPVREGEITESIAAIGEVKAWDSVDLVARVEGYLRKRNFQEGGQVRKGQLLYQIEPEIYQAEVKSAEAALDKARAARQNAEREYQRQQTLDQKQATTERVLELAESSKLEAEANVRSAEAALETARQNLSYTEITAPFDGWIGLSPISEGNLVNLNSGPLTTLQKIDPVRVEFVLNEMDLLALQQYLPKRSGAQTGKPEAKTGPEEEPRIRVTLFLQDGSRYAQPGRIRFWDNQLNTSTGTLKLQAEFANPQRRLIPGMFAKVELAPPQPHRALVIPEQALMTDQAGDYVYVVDSDGVVSRRTIRTGYRDQGLVVVTDKLQPGEQVIVEGVQQVRPGGRARAVPLTEPAAPGAPATAAQAAGAAAK